MDSSSSMDDSAAVLSGQTSVGGPNAVFARTLAWAIIGAMFLYLINNYLVYWLDWPGPASVLGGEDAPENGVVLGWVQFLSYGAIMLLLLIWVWKTPTRPVLQDAERLSAIAAYVIRAAFWSVLLVGLADMIISFMRIEGFLLQMVGQELTQDLGRSNYRGVWVHMPLIALSLVIAAFVRSLGFIWLALLVVIAEFQIVLARFIFSYEQAFMGDLVRFWYASLFIFASAYTLIAEGHVRVDVFYTRFPERKKAWSNVVGTMCFGVPLCWIILTRGMGGKSNVINSPLLSFEITQSGFGMYVKYLMAGFLAVFAVSMMCQFVSYFLTNIAVLRGEAKIEAHEEEVF